MNKFLAIFAVALGAVYSDLPSDDRVDSILLPFLFVAGMAYLFWFKGLVAIILGSAAAYHSDITSTSILYSILLPIFIVICFLYLLIWLHAMGLFDNDAFCASSDDDGGGGGFMDCDGGGCGD